MNDAEKLRSLISEHLEADGVYTKIREIVSNFAHGGVDLENGTDEVGESKSNASKEDSLLQSVYTSPDKSAKEVIYKAKDKSQVSISEREGGGFFEGSNLSFPMPFSSAASTLPSSSTSAAFNPSSTYLELKLLRGSAFTDHILEEDKDENGIESFLVVHLHFCTQRFRSKPVPINVEPQFNDTLLIELDKTHTSQNRSNQTKKNPIDIEGLLRRDSPIHLALLRVDVPILVSSVNEKKIDNLSSCRVPAAAKVQLLATRLIEWRHTLTNLGGVTIPVELFGIAEDSHTSIGVLHVKCSILPTPPSTFPAVVDRALALQRNIETASHRDFYRFAKSWWNDFLKIDKDFKKRMVKIFAENEWGDHRSVCSFIVPIPGGRVIDSALSAARFVSLLPLHRRCPKIGMSSPRSSPWSHFHTMLALRGGDVHDHATLLCSLLLGLGLDAYVCVGSAVMQINRGDLKTQSNKNIVLNSKECEEEEEYIWVVTIDESKQATLWDPLSGYRYFTKDLNTKSVIRKSCRFSRVGCLFRHNRFYANIQTSDTADTCDYNLSNRSKWKAMDPARIQALPCVVRTIPLCPPQINVLSAAEEMENEIKTIIALHRKSLLSLDTHWNVELSYFLAPALTAYEMERICTFPSLISIFFYQILYLTNFEFDKPFNNTSGEGQITANSFFQQSIKRAVPNGSSFRAFPIMFTHRNSEKVMKSLLASPAASKIIKTKGKSVKFALRVRVVAYPEDVVACWIMLAVTHYNLNQ